MAESIVIQLVTGLALFALLVFLLFTFSYLAERERTRSVSARPVAETKPPKAGQKETPKLNNTERTPPFSTPVGAHYLSDDLLENRYVATLTGENHDDGGRSSEAFTDNGVLISGFDSHGSKIYLSLKRQDLQHSAWGITVGRDPSLSDYEIRDHDDYVSRRHFRVRWNQEHQCYEIEDLASTSGTYVDDVRLEPFRFGRIRYGSTLKIGQLELDIGKV